LAKLPHAAPDFDSDSAYQSPEKIVPWRDPPAEYRQRDLAVAGLEISTSHKLAAIQRKSMQMLESLPVAQQNNDPGVLASLETAFLGDSAPEKALALSKWAVESVPKSATFAMNHGLALKRAGNLQEAERELLRAIELDPSLSYAYAELAVLYDSEGKREEALATIDRFLKWNPQTIQFRLARGH
jgi:tetratricopeptide (TPR) repeat protein